MKAYKSYSRALKAANGKPIIRVGYSGLYLVGDIHSLTEIAVINSENGNICGNICAGHLDRLGNGNWAKPAKRFLNKVFDCFEETEKLRNYHNNRSIED